MTGTAFWSDLLAREAITTTSIMSGHLRLDTGQIRQQTPEERRLSRPAEGRECWKRGLERFHAPGCPDDLCMPTQGWKHSYLLRNAPNGLNWCRCILMPHRHTHSLCGKLIFTHFLPDFRHVPDITCEASFYFSQIQQTSSLNDQMFYLLFFN